MDTRTKGPVATEIEARLRLALNPSHLIVVDDSDRHLGHAGHSGTGESHFTVELVSTAFIGRSLDPDRVEILEGVAPGDVVITTPGGLAEGAVVRVSE